MSDDFGLRGPKLPWTCPNDRQLALRAKLKTGWSVKTNTFHQYPKPPPLSEKEQAMIVSVVRKAEEYDYYEQQRVGKLVDRVESLKKLANGNGTTECILCGDTFRLYLFGRSNYKCHDCEMSVCRKCVVEITVVVRSRSKESVIRLCKLCSENRELMKKSGAWFFKGVPKYILPEKKNHYTNNFEKYSASPRSYQEQKYVSRYVNSSEDGPSTSSNNSTTTATPSASTSSAGAKSQQSSKTATASSSSASTNATNSTSNSKSGGGVFFWTKSLRYRSGSSSQQTTSDQEQESSSDEGGSHFLRRTSPSISVAAASATGASSSSSSTGPKHQASSPSATNGNGSNSQNGNSNALGTTGSWSMWSLTRGHSPPVSRLRQRDNSPLRSETSPGGSGLTAAVAGSTGSGENEHTSFLSGKEAPAPSSSHAVGATAEHSHSSSLELSLMSSKRKSVERFDFSKEALEQQGVSGGGAAATSSATVTSVANGDNNPRSSASSSTDCLNQQGLASTITNNTTTPSLSATSSATSAAAGSGQLPHGGATAPPLGVIQVALLYDDTHQALHCSVHHAKDLVPMDINGLSDPYCILKLIPSRYEGTHLRTKTVHKSVNPIFNETLTFYGVTPHDLTWQTLQILVMDDDRWGKDCLGTAQIPLHRIRSQQTRCFAQSLERGRLSEEREWGRGRLLLSLTYLTEKSLLLVGVIQAQDLPALDHNGTSDPFVKVRLLHDTNLGALSTSCFSSSSINRKFRTSVKWRTLNPEFREEFSLKVSIVDLPRLALVVSVWDKDLGKNDDYIGGIVLSNGSKGERLKHWLDMMKLPNTKHFKWHTLSPSALPHH